MDEAARRAILARRRTMIAAALAALGPACAATPAAPPRARGSEPGPAVTARAADGSRPSSVEPREQRGAPGPSTLPGSNPEHALADADGDGIADARDACPALRGVDAVDSMQAGCPARPCLSVIPPSQIEFSTRLHFAHGSSDVRADARATLDEVARVLDDHPEIELELTGHTDATEPENLAVERARRVRDALVQRGVSPVRLSVAGQGARQPNADNSSAEGRAQNRRVELVRRGPRTPLSTP